MQKVQLNEPIGGLGGSGLVLDALFTTKICESEILVKIDVHFTSTTVHLCISYLL